MARCLSHGWVDINIKCMWRAVLKSYIVERKKYQLWKEVDEKLTWVNWFKMITWIKKNVYIGF